MSQDVKRFDCTSGGAEWCYGCYTMSEAEGGDYVRAEDYDALLAENERLRTQYQQAAESSEHFAARAERLAEALRHTKEKLEHVAAIRGGHGTFAGTYLIVTEALDQEGGKGGKQ